MADAAEGVIAIEWIEGKSVRLLLPGGAEEETDEAEDEFAEEEDADLLLSYSISQGELDLLPNTSIIYSHAETLMTMIGTEIAKMHMADIIHGDLTTSNMMLRRPSDNSHIGLDVSAAELVRKLLL
jgi:TP53 regulating kinase and related kinases